MISPGIRKLAGWILGVLLVALAFSCNSGDAETEAPKSIAQGAAKQLLGGDSDAWPTARGNAGDAGFCKASLVVPLPEEPAWTAQYTPAEFSRRMVNNLVHYDGTIYLTASGPQLMAVDVESGKIKFNEPVYAHDGAGTQEELQTLYIHPGGSVIGRDDQGRHYCWDVANGLPVQRWITERSQSFSGYVAVGDYVQTAWNTSLAALSMEDGSFVWDYPALFERGGVVLAESGTTIWWSGRGGTTIAVDSASGDLLWQHSSFNPVVSILVDDSHGLIYCFANNESVSCYTLEGGDFLWQYSWSFVMDEEQRQPLHQYFLGGVASVRVSGATVLDDGVCFGVWTGDVFKLGMDGELCWHYKDAAPVKSLIGFENGILVVKYYSTGSRSPVQVLTVFSLERPDWVPEQELQPAGPTGVESTEEPVGKSVFTQVLVLGLEDGSPLCSLEPDLLPWTDPVPAKDKIVFAESLPSQIYTGLDSEFEPRKIQAFNWLDDKGK